MKTILKFLSYIRAILGFPFIFILTLSLSSLCILILFILSFFKFRKLELILGDFFLRLYSQAILLFFNIRVVCQLESDFPKKGCILLFNHSSHFDIPILSGSLKKRFRYGSKKELFYIPFFGRAMRSLQILPIVRGARAQVLKLYRDSVHKVHEGMSYMLAPEGTRGEGEHLQPFKRGPFIFAIEAQVPVVGVVIKGANKVLARKSLLVNWGIWCSQVDVTVLAPIETKGLRLEDVEMLKNQVQSKMAAIYEKTNSKSI